MLLDAVFSQFITGSAFDSYTTLNYGHINDTYLVKSENGTQFVLQRINNNVFKEAEMLIKNKVQVSLHIQQKLANFSKSYIYQHVLSFVKTKSGNYYYVDTENCFWNLSYYIEESITYLKVPNSEIAYQAGLATADFLSMTADLSLNSIYTILPDFHSIDARYKQFLSALNIASSDKKSEASSLINFIYKQQSNMRILDFALANKEVPLRLTHNDTKISNILFDKKGMAICLIDTDTVMPGILHYDYADAIRTICNTADEDEADLSKVKFELGYFKSYTLGFSQKIKENCTLEEVNLLPKSLQVLPFIMGLRFLTDYLNDDIYYKTKYAKHNFDRAANQFTLVKEIQNNFAEIKAYITEVYSS